jgi:hypothetical protein
VKNNNDNLLMSAIKDLGKLEAENRKIKSSLAKLKKQQKIDKKILNDQVFFERESARNIDVLSLRFSRLLRILDESNPNLKNEIEEIGK